MEALFILYKYKMIGVQSNQVVEYLTSPASPRLILDGNIVWYKKYSNYDEQEYRIQEYSSTTCLSHNLETNLNHKKMGTLQFYIPGFQNVPSYPKQKDFLKCTEVN